MTFRQKLRSLFTDTPFAETTDLTGRHVVVTGCSEQSLGYQTAKTLSHWGATVIITTRSDSESIVASLGHALNDKQGTGTIHGHDLDLSSTESVERFLAWYLAQFGERLDILVNNAGIHLDLLSKWKKPRLSADGTELHWRTNYLGTAHLTHQLLPLLKQTGKLHGDARVVNLVSQLHTRGSNDALFDQNTPYESWKFYGLSKLALIHFSFELQRRFSSSHNLQSYAVHPGGRSGVNTNIAGKGLEESSIVKFFNRIGAPLQRLFMANIEEGAQTQIHCATNASVVGGHYYVNCDIAPASPQVEDLEAATRLWTRTRSWIETSVI